MLTNDLLYFVNANILTYYKIISLIMLNEKDKKSLRQNRSTGTPAKTQFVSTYRVESDQKEIILAKLKSEA